MYNSSSCTLLYSSEQCEGICYSRHDASVGSGEVQLLCIDSVLVSCEVRADLVLHSIEGRLRAKGCFWNNSYYHIDIIDRV